MAGRLQNEDFKTLSELTGAGGASNQLLNDTKIYITNAALASQLSSLITSGDVLTSASLLKLGLTTDSTTTGTAAALPAATKGILRLTNASLVSISTITGQANGQYFVLINRTGNSITINDNDVANGIRTGTGSAMTVTNNASVVIAYDNTSARSQVIGGSGGSIATPVAIADGGTGQTTASTAFNALSPMTTAGDLIYGGASGAGTRLPIGSTGQVLSVVAGNPAWSAASSGVGATNYISNYNAEVDTTGWATYADAAGTVPVFGTGGSPTLTFTRTTSSPLSGSASFLITKDAANRQGNGASYDFTIDAADKAKVLQISFSYIVASGTFVAGNPADRTSAGNSDITVWIYDVTNGVLISPSTTRLYSNSSTIADKFVSNFQSSSNSTSYRLIFHCGTTSAVAYTLKADTVLVTPSSYVYGSPITDWQSYTPTGGWTTNSTYVGKWRRVGDVMEVEAKVSLAGAPNAANCTFNLPTGYTIDTTKMDLVTTTPLGQVNINKNATNSFLIGFSYYNSTTSVGIRYIRLSGSLYDAPNVDATTPFSFTTNDTVQGIFRVPITGWSSSVQMSDSADTRVVAARYSTAAGQSIAASSIVIVDFGTKTSDTHSAVTTGGSWKFTAPVSGKYAVKCSIRMSSSTTTGGTFLYLYKNGSAVSSNVYTNQQSTNGIMAMPVLVDTIDLVAGDYIDFRINHANAGSLTVYNDATYNYVDIERISGPSAIAANEVVAARYKSSASQSFASGATDIINFSTADFDTHGAVTTGASWKFTAPVAGKYQVNANTAIGAATDGGARQLYIYKNGAVWSQTLQEKQSTTSVAMYVPISDIVPCNAGDTIDLRYSQNSGGSLSFSGMATRIWVSIAKIGNY